MKLLSFSTAADNLGLRSGQRGWILEISHDPPKRILAWYMINTQMLATRMLASEHLLNQTVFTRLKARL